MTRKRLSDLLREEVKKVPEAESDSANSDDASTTASRVSTAKAPKSSSQTRSGRNRMLKTQPESTTIQSEEALEVAVRKVNSLEEQVTTLEAELEGHKKLIATLQGKVKETDRLQEALKQQKTLVEKLYAELYQAQAVQSELEEQKKLVEKLSAERQQTQAEKEAKERANPAESRGLTTKLVSSPILPARPIGRSTDPQSSSKVLSNEEIGWFD